MITILDQAENSRIYAQRKSNAHYLLAEKNKRKHTWLGIFATLFSTIVGTAIFATLTETPTDKSIKIVTGFLSVTAAVLAAFQTFFRFSEIGQQHKNAAVSYEAVRHQLDFFLLANSGLSSSDIKQTSLKDFEDISLQLTKIAETAPTIPDKIWDRIRGKLNMIPIIEKSNH